MNPAIGGWEVGEVLTMYGMFYNNVEFNQNLNDWDTAKVTNMISMFNGATAFNGDISKWNTAKVTNMRLMFHGATAFNGDIGDWNVSKVRIMANMFSEASTFNADIGRWQVHSVGLEGFSDFEKMFLEATSFNQDISSWDVTNAQDFTGMFANAKKFNQNLTRWRPKASSHMQIMFFNATSFNGDISTWFSQGPAEPYANSMFKGATSFDQDLSCWLVSGNSIITSMFEGATKFESNLNHWTYASNQATNAFLGSNMSSNCEPGQTGCELPRCTKMTDACLFWHRTQACRDGGDCSYVQELDISFMGDQGFGCLEDENFPKFPFHGLNTTLNLTAWRDRLPTSLEGLFAGYLGTEIIGIEAWDVSEVTDMAYMFLNATEFEGDLKCWFVKDGTDCASMFEGAAKFESNLNLWFYFQHEENQGINPYLFENMLTDTNMTNNVDCWYNETTCSLPKCKTFSDPCHFYSATAPCRDNGECEDVQHFDVSKMDRGFSCYPSESEVTLSRFYPFKSLQNPLKFNTVERQVTDKSEPFI